MAELKTKETSQSVDKFLNGIQDLDQKEDSKVIVSMMEKATGAKAKMWGPAIIGFGNKHLVYESGRELDWFIMGFSPRKTNLTFYFMSGLSDKNTLLEKLGKYKLGKGCLYVKRLAEIDVKILKKMIDKSAKA
jgi:hypothetical protein